jgi:hypothetical protein
MSWNYWVLRIAADADPPQEWSDILSALSGYIDDDYINKIEVAAFTIRGKRTARWLIPGTHSEFGTIENSIGAAKKLTWLLLQCQGAPGLNKRLRSLLACTKQHNKCALLEGHEGGCSKLPKTLQATRCPICLDVIKLDDFDLSGRTDLLSVQMGHLTPLSKISQGHTADNVVWVHRRCNYIQDEQTVGETIDTLRQIVARHDVGKK